MKISVKQTQFIRSLHSKKGRRIARACVVEGIRALMTWLDAGHRPHNLYGTSQIYDAYGKELSPYVDQLVIVDEATIETISSQVAPAGIIGIFGIPSYYPMSSERSLVLAGLQDPGNVGTLIRTAIALQITRIILVDTVDPWAPKVIQASAGTIAYARLSMGSWSEVISVIPADSLAALSPRGGVAPTALSAAVRRNLSVVVGNEGSGLPAIWQASCGHIISLPMPGGQVESLNAAVAGSIALYTLL